MAAAAAFPFVLASAAFAGGNGPAAAPVAEKTSGAKPEGLRVSSAAARGDSDAPRAPRRLAFGVNNLGGQLRFHVTPEWAAEARFVTGSASSNEGSIQSLVFGLRGYRFTKEHHRCRLYLGLEADRAQTSIHGSPNFNSNSPTQQTRPQGFGDTSGFAAGGFGGLELRVTRRVAVDLDMGPYLIGLKEKITGASASSWDFVVNTSLEVYLF